MGPEALKAQEPDEFSGLVLEELDSVYRLAHHLARSRDEAEDLVQETYLRAFKSRSTFRTTEHGVRPWLFKILHNTYKTRLERRQREPTAASDTIDGFPDNPAPPGTALDTHRLGAGGRSVEKRRRCPAANLSGRPADVGG